MTISDSRMNLETKSRRHCRTRQMRRIQASRRLKGIWKRVRKGATLSAVSHPGETLSICICLRNAKGVASKYRCFLENVRSGCSSGRKIEYREFLTRSKTLFSILEESLNSVSLPGVSRNHLLSSRSNFFAKSKNSIYCASFWEKWSNPSWKIAWSIEICRVKPNVDAKA